MNIFEPYDLEGITLSNRIVMAPMTRSRAIDNVPNELMKSYYEQRASAGLIITEGTSPSKNGLGYTRIPGAFNSEQQLGWKEIADGVHEAGGKIVVQLMHTGRASVQENLPKGGVVMSASSIQLSGENHTGKNGLQPYTIPKEMDERDIIKTQEEYAQSASLLIEAGIDGVELHSANGYLLDQFLNPASNNRQDAYGGNHKNRSRFVLETAHKVSERIGANKVGIRFSPYGTFNDMQGVYEDLVEMYTYLAAELASLGIAYIHIADQRVAMGTPAFETDIKKTIKRHFQGTVIVGGDVNTKEKAQSFIDEGYDLVYVGRPFISNPGLVDKLKSGVSLTAANFDLAFTPGPEGYTDYK